MLNPLSLLLLFFLFAFEAIAQPPGCTFKKPLIHINFNSGDAPDVNTDIANYRRVEDDCPRDGHYSYTSSTSYCFRGDWLTLSEDHTPGDAGGNMMIVNSSYTAGPFFRAPLKGLKGSTTYEFALWLMNVCRISEKCPFPLLPNITVQLQTPSGGTVARFSTGEVARRNEPHWTRYRAAFTTPPGQTALLLTLVNNAPGGCGNDFAMDDITVWECVKTVPVLASAPKTGGTPKLTVTDKRTPPVIQPSMKKTVSVSQKKEPLIIPATQRSAVIPALEKARTPRSVAQFIPAPPALTRRMNTTVKEIPIEAGEISIALYDNGEVDGDTVSIYHNNKLVVAHARLSQKPIKLNFAVDPSNPYHEVIMVAENLGTIPPNTSVMMVTAGAKRYQVFITSTEQKNGKVVFQLKE